MISDSPTTSRLWYRSFEDNITHLDQRRKAGEMVESEFRKTKIVPSYTLPKDFLDTTPSYFPKSNVIHFPSDVHIRWKNHSYSNIDYEFPEFKHKNQFVGIFVKNELIATAQFSYYKNATDDFIEHFDFHNMADADSEAKAEFAAIVIEAFQQIQIEKRKKKTTYSYPGEIYAEFTLLRITKKYAGSKLWITPLQTFIEKVVRTPETTLLAMKAQPLEYVDFANVDIPDIHKKNYEKRLAAMVRFYKYIFKAQNVTSRWLVRFF